MDCNVYNIVDNSPFIVEKIFSETTKHKYINFYSYFVNTC